MKAIYVGTAATLLLSTVTPQLAEANFDTLDINIEQFENEDELYIFIQEQLELIDEHYKIEFDLEENKELFVEKLEEIIRTYQNDYELEITGKIDQTLLDHIATLIETKDEQEEIEQDKIKQEDADQKENELIEEEVKIDELEENNEEITEQQETQTFSANSKSTTPTVLKDGMRHAKVKTLKEDLKKLGFTVPGNGTTLYGKETAKQVKAFQNYYSLKVTGEAGPETFEKIDSILKSPLQKGKRHSDTKKLKADLKLIGYAVPGKGTTLYGKDTEAMVEKFQEDYKLAVSGIAEEVTLKIIADLKKQKENPSILENGMRHAKVKTLKANLKKAGFTVPGNGTTLFGSDTEKKVKEFQKYFNLSVTGKVDKQTDDKLLSVVNSPLQNGKKHSNTKTLKADLKAIGYPVPGNGTTLYGKDTEAVVKKFQKDYRLVVNGIADEVTLKKIAELKKANVNPSVLEKGMRHTKVKTLKTNLKKAGFTVPGNGTTLFGAETEKKVKEFQRYYGLSVTGKVDKITDDKILIVVNSPLQNGKRHKDTVKLKKDLAKIGFTVKGNNTTLYGIETEKQVKAFQKKFKLVVNGIADEVTLRKIESEVKNAEAKPVNKTEYTDYKLSLNQAIDIQLRDSLPQTDKYRNSPAYVSKSYIKLKGKGKITGKNVNVRSQPNGTAKVSYKVKNGETVNVVKEVKGSLLEGTTKWYQISNSGKLDYILAKYVDVYEGEVNVSEALNVRAGKSTSSHIFGQLTNNSKVTIKSKSNSWYEINYGTWRLPTKSDLSSAMNPNNGDKFQHIRLDSLAGATASQLNKTLNTLGTKSVLHGQGQAFINGAKQGKVNEAYLVAHAILETGGGTSKLATGIEVGKNKNGKPTVVTNSNRSSLTAIKKVYNVYGIGAVDSNPNNAGAIKAYELGWDTPKKAIEGGAKWVGEEYIHNAHKQNTLYKMRWNPRMVEGFTWKQYASDINWATKQTAKLKEIYNNISKPSYHYDIPKYR